MTHPFVPAAMRLFAGGIVWALHFTIVYAVAALVCAERIPPQSHAWTLGLVTAAALALLAALLVPALRRPRDETASFARWMTATLAGLAVLAIVWEALAAILAPRCV